MMGAIREALDPWLGTPQYRQTEGRVPFRYHFRSEDVPSLPLRLKVEMNSREHFVVYGCTRLPFTVSSRWFEGSSEVATDALEELLATKLRALDPRRKGRDLFDLAVALEKTELDPDRVISAFSKDRERGGRAGTRAQFEQNLAAKLRDGQFNADLGPLLAPGFPWDGEKAAESVRSRVIVRLPGDPWKSDDKSEGSAE